METHVLVRSNKTGWMPVIPIELLSSVVHPDMPSFSDEQTFRVLASGTVDACLAARRLMSM